MRTFFDMGINIIGMEQDLEGEFLSLQTLRVKFYQYRESRKEWLAIRVDFVD